MMRNFAIDLFLLTALVSAANAGNELPEHLKAGDRIVFYGDSITEQKLYTNYVESYLTLRYPDAKFEFFNAGWSGDMADGGLWRLKRDLLVLKPTVVTICYGMNDGWYSKYTEGCGDYYRKNMSGIIKKLKKEGIRPVLLTPGITDDPMWSSFGYNDTLRELADIVLAMAEKEGLPAYDLHKLMSEVNEEGKARNKDFSVVDEPDLGIHPQEPGQMVMAYALLKALGVPPRQETITAEKKKDDEYRFSLKSLPFFVEGKARPILALLPFMEDFNRVTLTIPDTEKCPYHLEFGGSRILSYTEIKDGLDLAEMWESPPMRHAARIHAFTKEKNDIYYKFWRSLGMQGNFWVYADLDADLQRIGIEASRDLELIRWEKAQPPEEGCKFRLTPLRKAAQELVDGSLLTRFSYRGPYPGGKSPLERPARFTSRVRELDRDWKSVILDMEKPGDNLGNRFWRAKDHSILLYTVIESPVPQAVSCLIGSDDSFTLWLNGREAGKANQPGGYKENQDVIELSLEKGANPILVEVWNKSKDFGFAMRFKGLKAQVTSVPPTLAKLVEEAKRE